MIDSNIRFSRVDQLTLQLKERCLTLGSGEKFLSQRQIMTEFNVSQITVKQAVERLCDSGVLEAEDRRGYFVRRNRRFGKIITLLPDVHEGLAGYLTEASHKIGFEHETLYYGENDEEGIRMLAACKADAILFRPFDHNGLDSAQLNRIQAFPFPVFLLYTSPRVENCRYVDSDNEFCGVLAATALMLKGHRKLGLFISEPKTNPTQLRVSGFLKTAQAFDLEVEILDPKIEYGEHSPSRSRDFFRDYLTRTPKPPFTALFAVSALPTRELMRVATEHGLSIPEKLSLISIYSSSAPFISSVDPRSEEICRRSIGMIEDFFNHKTDVPLNYIIPPRIHNGNTLNDIATNHTEKN